MILEKLVVGPLGTNCYIVADEKTGQGMIIDPGYHHTVILDKIKELGLTIEYVILTHGHFDHIAALGMVSAALDVKVAIHYDDVKVLEDKLLGSFINIIGKAIPSPDVILKGGEEIKVGELTFTVLHTPGHTQGCISLYGQGVCFSGDTLFNAGVGRTDLSGGNSEQIIKSIKEKLMTLPDEIKVYPGHGPETTIGAERRGNPFI